MLAAMGVEVGKQRCKTSAEGGRKQSCKQQPLLNMQTNTLVLKLMLSLSVITISKEMFFLFFVQLK